jgi:hypothetical protein
MRTGVSFTVSTEDHRRMEAVIADRNTPQKHVWRCRIVLGTADGCCHLWMDPALQGVN